MCVYLCNDTGHQSIRERKTNFRSNIYALRSNTIQVSKETYQEKNMIFFYRKSILYLHLIKKDIIFAVNYYFF